MKVVRKTILDKILALLPDEDIIRIELTGDEFSELLHAIKLRKFEVDKAVLTYAYKFSGSYLVFKGVCIQTHRSYREGL